MKHIEKEEFQVSDSDRELYGNQGFTNLTRSSL